MANYEIKRFDDGEPLDVTKLNLMIDNIQNLIGDNQTLRNSTVNEDTIPVVESGTATFENLTANKVSDPYPIKLTKISEDALVAGKVRVVASPRNALRDNEEIYVSVADVRSGTPKLYIKVLLAGKTSMRSTYYVDWIAVENRAI